MKPSEKSVLTKNHTADFTASHANRKIKTTSYALWLPPVATIKVNTIATVKLGSRKGLMRLKSRVGTLLFC